MILFLNCFLTDNRMGSYDRYNVPNFRRIDVLKYTIASYAALAPRWTSAYFYIQLDHNYQSEWDGLEKFIRNLFNCPIHIFTERCYHRKDWQKAVQLILDEPNDENVWWFNNDDHVCVASEYDMKCLDAIDKRLKEDKTHPETLAYISHFIEVVNSGGRNPQYIDENCCSIIWHNTDSISIVTKNTLKKWFFTYDLDAVPMIKSDFIQCHKFDGLRCIIPFRELVRHFDGHSHCGNLANLTPPLGIPEGFFENNIKILYCTNERKPGWTTVNPMSDNLFAACKHGADYKYTLDELPLAWSGRISEIDDSNASKYTPEEIIAARNIFYSSIVNPKVRIGGWPGNDNMPIDWFKAWLK